MNLLSCPRCSQCANRNLAEFFAPAGLVLCSNCGAMFQRTPTQLRFVGAHLRPAAAFDQVQPPRDPVEVRQRTAEIVASRTHEDVGSVVERLERGEDLDVDSLETVEIIMALEDEFGINLNSERTTV